MAFAEEWVTRNKSIKYQLGTMLMNDTFVTITTI